MLFEKFLCLFPDFQKDNKDKVRELTTNHKGNASWLLVRNSSEIFREREQV